MAHAPFLRSGRGVHPVIDIDLLERAFPGDIDNAWKVCSASELLSWEQQRHWYGIEDKQAIPCDIFVWGIGKAPDLRLTRVGGVPFLPKRIPWPTAEGRAMHFLCQFDFRDSRDLVGQTAARELPGDLLLVFIADMAAMDAADVNRMRFIWVSAKELDADIVTAADVPSVPDRFEFITAWGTRFRTSDVPSKWAAAYAIAERGGIEHERVCFLPVYRATKIGGIPCDSQENHTEIPGNYLCQITSIQARPSSEWPWVDRKSPLNDNFEHDGIHHNSNDLMIGDMGELTLYIDSDNHISAEVAW